MPVEGKRVNKVAMEKLKKESNVLRLVDKSNDRRHLSVDDMLCDIIDFVADKPNHNKAIIILLDTSNNDFELIEHSCGMKLSEGVAVLDIMKSTIKRDMGY